jgi:hypothetical protein
MESNYLHKYPQEVLLSGGDCFFLAMEGHFRKYSTSGNVCHLYISVGGKITNEILRQKISEHPIFTWMSQIELDRGGIFGLPKWVYHADKKSAIQIVEQAVEQSGLPESVIQYGIPLEAPCLFRFTLLHLPGGTTDLVFSWHHVLMDAQGAETLIKLLGGEIQEENVRFFPEKEKKINPFKAFYKLHVAKEFVKKSSKKPLVQLVKKKPDYEPVMRYHVIELTEEQTRMLDQRAVAHGAGISKGSFYLASTFKAVNEWLVSQNNTKGAFWVPVPQNRRPRGMYGPVLSNLQAFMFYRMPREKITSLQESTAYITKQMFDLIRSKLPDDYAVMSDLLRRLPSKFYYWLIKGPAGGSVASFLYTDPGVNVFRSFMGYPVSNLTNYPPGTFPPGLMTVFERFNGKQKIIFNYTQQVVSREDLTKIERNLLHELLGQPVEAHD